MAHSAIVDAHILSEALMEALQITGVITLACVATMSLLYGEISSSSTIFEEEINAEDQIRI